MTIALLRDMLKKYFDQLITKEELGVWAKKKYFALVKGDYIVIDNLKIYHFIRTISRFHIVPDDIKDEYPCSEDEVKSIFDIINGDVDKTLTFKIKIPRAISDNFCKQYNIDEFYMNKFDKIKKHMIEYNNGQALSNKKIRELILLSDDNHKNTGTLFNLLEDHFRGILYENVDWNDEIFECKKEVNIYVTRNENDKIELYSSLLKLLNCITGDSEFRVSVTYNKGRANLSLLI